MNEYIAKMGKPLPNAKPSGKTTQGQELVRDISLSFVYPPIPDRNFDWQAYRKGWEPGEAIGQGRTPIVALADLLEKELEQDDPDHSTASRLARRG